VRRAVRAVADEGAEVQVGGGVRDDSAVAAWLEVGAALVVLGSLAVREPARAEEVCRAFPGRVLLGLDVRGDVAQADGWTADAGSHDAHLALWRDWPAAGVVRTDVARDGALSGPDLEGLRRCVGLAGMPVIASGGISTLDDIAACAVAGASACIIGRAVYEGRIELGEAFARFPAHRAQA
jgi:phosphoribosylformimino-5-aminoimidazole carboxamide ribotide isomerase